MYPGTNQEVPKLSWGSHTYAFKVIQIYLWCCDSLFHCCLSVLLFLFNPPIVRDQLISTQGREQSMLVDHEMYLKHLPEWSKVWVQAKLQETLPTPHTISL